MKLRSIELAGAAVLALSTPALAENPGWDLGLGIGYDQLESVRGTYESSPPLSGELSYSGNAIYTGSAGYKWDSGMRVELEVGYDDHDASKLRAFGFAGSIGHPFLTGGTSTTSALVNFVYDWDLGNAWSLSFGGGVGAGAVNHYEHLSDGEGFTAKFVGGAHTEFEWQA